MAIQGVKLIKKADIKPKKDVVDIPFDELTDFQRFQARVEVKHACETIKLYGKMRNDADFGAFFSHELRELIQMFPASETA